MGSQLISYTELCVPFKFEYDFMSNVYVRIISIYECVNSFDMPIKYIIIPPNRIIEKLYVDQVQSNSNQLILHPLGSKTFYEQFQNTAQHCNHL